MEIRGSAGLELIVCPLSYGLQQFRVFSLGNVWATLPASPADPATVADIVRLERNVDRVRQSIAHETVCLFVCLDAHGHDPPPPTYGRKFHNGHSVAVQSFIALVSIPVHSKHLAFIAWRGDAVAQYTRLKSRKREGASLDIASSISRCFPSRKSAGETVVGVVVIFSTPPFRPSVIQRNGQDRPLRTGCICGQALLRARHRAG